MIILKKTISFTIEKELLKQVDKKRMQIQRESGYFLTRSSFIEKHLREAVKDD